MPDLPHERLGQALDCVAAWRDNPGGSHGCPVCAEPGLEILDQSARPHVEWYILKCRACGLDATLNIPMLRPPPI
jgi:hypothetical protein